MNEANAQQLIQAAKLKVVGINHKAGEEISRTMLTCLDDMYTEFQQAYEAAGSPYGSRFGSEWCRWWGEHDPGFMDGMSKLYTDICDQLRIDSNKRFDVLRSQIVAYQTWMQNNMR